MSPRHVFRACAAAGAAVATSLSVLVGSAGAATALADPHPDAAAPAAAATAGPVAEAPADPVFMTAALAVRLVPAHRHRPLRSLPPRRIGHLLAHRAGWRGGEWSCLDALWTRESHWRVHDTNAHSGAYGIPQALPAEKMGTVAGDWRNDPVTQIRWGLHYIDVRYGSPCAAWSHSQEYGYY